jgi:hypothetical protein
MDALRGKLDHAFALQRFPGFVEHDQIARARLGPVQAEGQDQVAVLMAGDRDREVIVDALFQLVQYREPVGGGEVDLGLPDRVGRGRSCQGMDGHGPG